jgi:transporter family protein
MGDVHRCPGPVRSSLSLFRRLPHTIDMKPFLFAIAAGLCWGVGEIFTKSVLHTGRIGPVTAIAVRSTVALPVLWLAYFIVVRRFGLEPRTWTSAGSGTILKLVLGSGLIAGAGGMIFFYAALNVGEISRIKPIAFTIAPAVAVLLGCTIMGEELTVRKLVAVAMVLGGVALLTTK